jgi:hypothetical protein
VTDKANLRKSDPIFLTTIRVRRRSYDVTVDQHGTFRTMAFGEEVKSLTLAMLTHLIIKLGERKAAERGEINP